MSRYAPIHWTKHVFWLGIMPVASISFGAWLERKETNRMSRFRDKSALFGKELKPGDPPSWP